jgi:hypothetical protein
VTIGGGEKGTPVPKNNSDWPRWSRHFKDNRAQTSKESDDKDGSGKGADDDKKTTTTTTTTKSSRFGVGEPQRGKEKRERDMTAWRAVRARHGHKRILSIVDKPGYILDFL